jgi:hypothetical protein
MSKDKVQRILRRIEKEEIEITESGKVMDRSKPKGIVAYQQMAKQTLEPSSVTSSDPLETLLKSPWNIECDKCGKPFQHSFTDVKTRNLIKNSYAYVECPTCTDNPPGDIFGIITSSRKIPIRLADIFRSHNTIKAKSI